MIDTLRLGSLNFECRDDHAFDVQTIQKHGMPAVSKLTRNEGTLRTTVERSYQGEPFLKVELSAPKYLFGSSLREVTESDYGAFIDKLSNDLDSFGIGVDVSKMMVGRADACRNLHLSTDVSSFIEGCSDFNIGRTERHTYAGETIRFGNNTWSSQYYDKQQESAARELKEARSTRDKERIQAAKMRVDALKKTTHNILRAESAAKNVRGVMKMFGGGSVSRIDRVNRFAPPVLADVWNEEKSRKILIAHFDEMRNGAKGKTIPPHFDDLLKQLIVGRESKRRSIINDLIRQDGAARFLARCGGSIETMQRLLMCAGFSRMTAYNQTRRIKRDIALSKPISTFDILAEVREKLAA